MKNRAVYSMSRLGKIGKSFTVAGCLVTIGDLVQPIGPFATYFAAASLIVLTTLGVIRLFSNKWNEILSTSSYFSCLVFILSSAIIAFQYSSEKSNTLGVIASNLDFVQAMQSNLGMITEELNHINNSIRSVDKKIDSIKKEVSSNPRKELANLGIPWKSEEFYTAIRHDDTTIISLFFQGGMQLDRVATDYSQNSILTQIIYEPPSNWRKVLEQAKYFGFNFNSPIRYRSGSEIITPISLALRQEQYAIAEYILRQNIDTTDAKKLFKDRIRNSQSILARPKPRECTRSEDDYFNNSYGNCVRSYNEQIKKRRDAELTINSAQRALDLINSVAAK